MAYRLLVSLLLLSWGVAGKCAGAASPDENFVIASVMVAGPGEELYSRLGHAFLRMQCPDYGMDYCFTYESEDVSQKVLSFLGGGLRMGMMAQPTDEFLSHYALSGRSVTEYGLNLPVAVKQNLWRILDGKVEQGASLPYDYMERGCAYSTFNIVKEAMGIRPLAFGVWPDDFRMTRREVVCSRLDDAPWMRLFLNIITNGEIDDDVPYQEKTITPEFMLEAMKIASVDGHPLLAEGKEILPQTVGVPESPWLTPMKVALLLLVLTLIGALAANRLMLYVILCIQTVLGLFVCYLLFFSSLCATESSWLVIPFNPLPLLLWKWRRYWEIPAAGVLLVWGAAMALGGAYLTDPALIILDFCCAAAYIGDVMQRKGITRKILELTLKTKNSKLKTILAMKKSFLFLFAAIVALTSFQAKAYDPSAPDNFFVTCKVKVADDSNGRGKVYIDCAEGQVDEHTAYSPNQMPPVEYKDVPFKIITVPEEGYVFTYFTDQNGNPHYYADQNERTVNLAGYSGDISNPTFYELSAHFVEAGELPSEEFFEVNVGAIARFATFIAPISIDLPDNLVAYRVTGTEGDAVILEESYDYGETIPAFTAVLIENTGVFDESLTGSYSRAQLPDPLPSLTTGLLTGTLEDLEVAPGNYILNADGEDSTFDKLTSESLFINAYTCYLSVADGADYYTFDKPESGVETLLSPAEKTEIYNLDGVRIDRLQKGINIVNGVKVIVK